METKLICLTTFDYTTISSSYAPSCCPSCGFKIDIKHDHFLNRLSSLMLLIGASAYVGYKLSHYSDNMKRISGKFWQMLGWNGNQLEPVFFDNKPQPFVKFNEYKLLVNDYPDLDFAPPRTPMSPFMSAGSEYDMFADNSCSSLSAPNVQNMTIAKIDEVLTQIDDIKKSIVEIDSQLFNFSGSKCAAFNPDFLSLTNADLEDESPAETFGYSAAEPKTPCNLEWDASDDDISFSFDDDLGLNARLSLPVTDAEKQKLKTMNELLEEAKQLGLLNNILEALNSKVQNNNHNHNNRDSAYFEV